MCIPKNVIFIYSILFIFFLSHPPHNRLRVGSRGHSAKIIIDITNYRIKTILDNLNIAELLHIDDAQILPLGESFQIL